MSSIGIISALPFESQFFTGNTRLINEPVRISDKLYIVTSGMGIDCVESAIEQLFKLNISILISWGTAAALDSDLHSGDLVLPDKILSQNGKLYITDKDWNSMLEEKLAATSININNATLFSNDKLLDTPEVKSDIHMKTGAIAADMESYIIASKASERNIPFLVIRSIIDEADCALPTCVLNNIDNYGRAKLHCLLLDLIRSPSQLTTLLKLSKSMNKAGYTLKTTANIILDAQDNN